MNGLAAYAKATIQIYGEGKFGYVYGAQGEVITDEALKELQRKYSPVAPGEGYYESERVRKWLGKQAADCSGLIMYFMQKMNIYTFDKTADDLMNDSKNIVAPAEGDLAFKISYNRAYHVGIYVGDYTVIHSRGTDYGVVQTLVSDYRWDTYGRIFVPDIHWAEPYYQFLLDKGISYSDKRFDDKMTRGEYFASKAKEFNK